MTVKERYEAAREMYKAMGVDTDKALEALKRIPVSMHCWQGDDVVGFDGAGALSGGIQTTGDYPGRARTPEELMADMDKALEELEALQAAAAAPSQPEIELEPWEEEVDFDTFAKSDFRVVKVKECEPVKKSKKLLKFTLDDGTGTPRQILSGIAM